MKRSAPSQNSHPVEATASSSCSTRSKNQQSDNTRKSKSQSTTNAGTNIRGRHDTQSDISADEADEPVSRKRRKVSIVHSYADKLTKSTYKCTICNKIIRCSVTSNSNVKRHLIGVHGLDHLRPMNDEYESSERLDPYRKNALDTAAINCIIADSRPFGDFQKFGMKQFLATAIPGYTGPHRNLVAKEIKDLYTQKLIELKNQLNNICYVSLTADLWKRPKGHHYLCVTVHFVDEHYRNISKVLSFRRFHGRHLSSRIRRHLNRVVNRFGLESKITAIVTDNGSDIRAATQNSNMFGTRLYSICHGLNLTVKNGLQLWKKEDSKKKSTDSMDSHDENQYHTLDIDGDKENQYVTSDEAKQSNASAEVDDEEETTSTSTLSTDDDETDFDTECDFDEVDEEVPHDDLEVISSDDETDYEMMDTSNDSFDIDSISDVLYNCRKIVNIINKSSILYQITQKLARPDIKHDLSVDMRIRWNSTSKMVCYFNEYEHVLNQLMYQLPSVQGLRVEQKKKLLNLRLSNAEWEIMKVLESVLSVFREGSDMLSGSNYPSYSMAYQVIDTLNLYLQKSTAAPIKTKIKEALLEALDRYVLHPLGSPEYNLMLMCAFIDPEMCDSMSDTDKGIAKKLLTTENNKKIIGTQSIISISPTSDLPNDKVANQRSFSNAERLKLFRVKCGIIDDEQEPVKMKNLSFRQELTKHESLDKTDHTFNTFWKKHEDKLPILSKMARRYGCVPASSVPSESSFSIAGHIARKSRSSLSAKSLKYSMFLKDKIF